MTFQSILLIKTYQNFAYQKQISHIHEPCTLQHGQKLSGLVESILSQFGYIKKPIKDSHICCGSAGTYSIFESEISNQLLVDKLENLNASSPEMICD